MRTWVGLYLLVWLVFLELLVAMAPGPPAWFIYVHAPLGLLIIGVAYANLRSIRATTAPGRTKRTVSATFTLTLVMAVLGVLLWAQIGAGVGVLLGFSVWDLLHIFHVVNALAIIAQAASAATAFDMWEEHEFERPTTAGTVPPAPRPAH